jgi:hypothetical protein
MKRALLILCLGYLAGLLLLGYLESDLRKGACVGWVVSAVIELVLLRRRVIAVSARSPQVAFLLVLSGGFLIKLLLLSGLALLAAGFELFHPTAFMLAFLAALVWGEIISLSLLHRLSRQRPSPGSRSCETETAPPSQS